MSNSIRSAKGDFVDFELLAIKAQLAAVPAPAKVLERKEAIVLRDSGKSASVQVNEMLAAGNAAAEESIKAAPKRK